MVSSHFANGFCEPDFVLTLSYRLEDILGKHRQAGKEIIVNVAISPSRLRKGYLPKDESSRSVAYI